MPNLNKEPEISESAFKKLIDRLPYNTLDIKKGLEEEGLMNRSTIHKWYSGSNAVKNAYTIALVVKYLNTKFPMAGNAKITINDLMD